MLSVYILFCFVFMLLCPPFFSVFVLFCFLSSIAVISGKSQTTISLYQQRRTANHISQILLHTYHTYQYYTISYMLIFAYRYRWEICFYICIDTQSI